MKQNFCVSCLALLGPKQGEHSHVRPIRIRIFLSKVLSNQNSKVLPLHILFSSSSFFYSRFCSHLVREWLFQSPWFDFAFTSTQYGKRQHRCVTHLTDFTTFCCSRCRYQDWKFAALHKFSLFFQQQYKRAKPLQSKNTQASYKSFSPNQNKESTPILFYQAWSTTFIWFPTMAPPLLIPWRLMGVVQHW